MSFISQIGMVVLIIFILLLIRESNRQVKEAYEACEKEIQSPEKPLKEIPLKRFAGKIDLIRLDENHYPKEKIRVPDLPFTIGRGRENSLVLEDLYVAREHCILLEEEGKIILRDRGTANKIFTEGKLCEEVEVYNEQRVYIGNEEFMMILGMES